ncbi:MAG: type II toxin-antitoxin system Phd/YefM family antitoxin [Planctomycetaceae bacterium]|jgi:PHD/YefM family antitoxin component YafN of YafNO toxin-antitoxin module|nr:type II toxin-antitoxin system Phd/YefM family antitoxin [Planctomycetaceae bacterium]
MSSISHTTSFDFFQDHAVEIFNELSTNREPYLITVNGQAKAVLQDIESYEEMQKNVAFIEAAVQRFQEIEDGKMIPMEETFKRLRQHATQ